MIVHTRGRRMLTRASLPDILPENDVHFYENFLMSPYSLILEVIKKICFTRIRKRKLGSLIKKR